MNNLGKGISLTILLCVQSTTVLSHSWRNITKKVLTMESNNSRTYYCDCTYDENKAVSTQGCKYDPKTPLTSTGNIDTRAYSVEIEHVVPASKISEGLICGSRETRAASCGTKTTRSCCLSTDVSYTLAYNDLINLVPAIGEVNLYRSNKPFGIIPGEVYEFGSCNLEIVGNFVEPREDIRGDISRIYFYMRTRYGITTTAAEYDTLIKWSLDDPKSATELERNEEICNIQGFGNPYVSECVKKSHTHE